jgi:GNAT superfamily N-acetyltransferase
MMATALDPSDGWLRPNVSSTKESTNNNNDQRSIIFFLSLVRHIAFGNVTSNLRKGVRVQTNNRKDTLMHYSALAYEHVVVNVLIFGQDHVSPLPEGLTTAKPTHFSSDRALRLAMQEAHSWDELEIRRREHLGDLCYMVLDGDRCVHYSWATRQMRYISEVGYQAYLQESDEWIYDCYTSPLYRGRSIYPHILSHIVEEARRAHRDHVWIDVKASNQSSLHGIGKAGFTPVASLERKTLFSSVIIERRKTVLDTPWTDSFNRMPFAWVDPRHFSKEVLGAYGNTMS